MVRGRRSNRRPGRKFGRFNSNRRVTRKLDFTGSLRGISRVPRISQDAPWNSITVQRSIAVTDSTVFSITNGYLLDVLRNQLNLLTVDLTYRVMAMDVFDTKGRPFEMKVFDYGYNESASNGTLSLITAVAWPGRMQWSSARFVWPKAISARPLSAQIPGTRLIASGAVGTPSGVESVGAGSLILRVRYLWRPTQPQTTPTSFEVKLASNAIPKDVTDGLVDSGVPKPKFLEHDTVEYVPTPSQRMESISF